VDLKTAQTEIASDWIGTYKKYVGKSPPAPRVRETENAPATATKAPQARQRNGGSDKEMNVEKNIDQGIGRRPNEVVTDNPL
jgi:hypothetical protein